MLLNVVYFLFFSLIDLISFFYSCCVSWVVNVPSIVAVETGRGACTYSVVLGRVLVSLQDLDPVPTAKPLDLPHCQVSKFLVKVKEKNIYFIPQILLIVTQTQGPLSNQLTN